jgi:CRISPR-associated protein Cmr6
MRDRVLSVAQDAPASHFGHAYDLLARPPANGKIDPDKRDDWLRRCEQIAVSADYHLAYERWRRSFAAVETTMREVVATSRILVGHGNPSGSDVGLTVHRSWGVPVLPGSSLKGLVAQYTDAVYGGTEEPARRAWRGPTWSGRRITKEGAPGEAFAGLFGSPAVDGDEDSARRGLVEFHDALYVPGSALGDRPFARDVLTVHQKPYYDGKGKDWPNDWSSPNPVAFMTVRPGTKFLLALTGPGNWADQALRLLLEALAQWGVGGKTSAGYGRLK